MAEENLSARRQCERQARALGQILPGFEPWSRSDAKHPACLAAAKGPASSLLRQTWWEEKQQSQRAHPTQIPCEGAALYCLLACLRSRINPALSKAPRGLSPSQPQETRVGGESWR